MENEYTPSTVDECKSLIRQCYKDSDFGMMGWYLTTMRKLDDYAASALLTEIADEFIRAKDEERKANEGRS